MFKDIDSTLEWLMNRRSKGNLFLHFKEVCERLGNPQNDFYMIHVAGTDGKGSTVNYLSYLLMSQGYKVGTLTSPHYITHQDRIRVNNRNIPDDYLIKFINDNYDFIIENKLAMFEIDYLMMCQYFKDERVDFAIVEVGMGGRLDSTNVVDNTKLSIITTIGYDHMDRLGNTLPEICFEKCGIIKNNSKVLIGHLEEECKNVVRKVVKERNCLLYELGDIKDLGERKIGFDNREYELSSYALYQKHNASLALYAFKLVCEDLDINVDYKKAKEYLKKAVWNNRFEIVKEKPLVILDGGHNIHGIAALAESFDQFKGSKCIIFSALKKKEYKKMVEILEKHCDKLVITTFDYNGVLDLKQLSDHEIDEDYVHAIDEAIKNYDNILICGSLYFMSDVVLNYNF